jgi:hypothetical protein
MPKEGVKKNHRWHQNPSQHPSHGWQDVMDLSQDQSQDESLKAGESGKSHKCRLEKKFTIYFKKNYLKL